MIANYEKRTFQKGEHAWIGKYKSLHNIPHWHFECELIHVISGTAEIMIDSTHYPAQSGEWYFCGRNQMHYIQGAADSIIEVMIFDGSACDPLLDSFSLKNPLLDSTLTLSDTIACIRHRLSEKGEFYCQYINNAIEKMLLDIFSSQPKLPQKENTDKEALFYQSLIAKIHDSYADITFEDAVAFSGYSPTHFSRIFKKASGMTFSEYLNHIKVEQAIRLIKEEGRTLSMAKISNRCGFGTIRNFNRVFRKLTGFSPKALPQDYVIDREIKLHSSLPFDPTAAPSQLI